MEVCAESLSELKLLDKSKLERLRHCPCGHTVDRVEGNHQLGLSDGCMPSCDALRSSTMTVASGKSSVRELAGNT